MSELDEVTFDETIGLEIQGWIMNLEANQSYWRSDRLYRRSRGDYTQADFARTSDEEEETEAIVRRDEKLSEFINKLEFSERKEKCDQALAQITSALLVNAKLYDRDKPPTPGHVFNRRGKRKRCASIKRTIARD